MKGACILAFLIISPLFPVYSQQKNIGPIWMHILEELHVPKDYCYESIESAIAGDKAVIEVSKLENKYDNHVTDFSYTVSLDNCK